MSTEKDIHFYIVCPTYNSEKYILNAINSVEKQTYSNWTLIVVDDGSTDSTYDILLEKSHSNSKIIAIKKENEGPFLTRERGIEYIRNSNPSDSDYIVFLDSDDLLEKRALLVLNDKLKNDDYDFICYNSRWFTFDGKVKSPYYSVGCDKILTTNKDIVNESIICNTYSYIWSVCSKAKLLCKEFDDKDKCANLKMCEDYLRLVPLYYSSNKAFYSTDSLYIHFDNPVSIVHGISFLDWIDWLNIIADINENAVKHYQELEQNISDRKIISYCNQLVVVLKQIVKNCKKIEIIFSYFEEIASSFFVTIFINRKVSISKNIDNILFFYSKHQFAKVLKLIKHEITKDNLRRIKKSSSNLFKKITSFLH